MTTLSAVWGQVKELLANGISLIPVRDKDETNKTGDVYLAKTPYKSWKEFQQRRATETDLWELMEEKDTSAIAAICGKISGNIEVIDVDVKYKPGIDAILLTDIKNFYPDLYDKIRIHKTPSGGYHIIYRVTGGEVPGNLKLAGRLASDEELASQQARGIKRPNKEVNFLETRGEGGYILCPPSLGYSVLKDSPIPVITWEERCSLITLCQTYTEIVKEAPKPKPNKSQDSIYEENPFEHYNRTVDPTQLMEENGWKVSHHNNHFIWYTRPDKDKGVSASWNKDKQIFFVFTTSTELQGNRGYHPATLLADLKFGGDKSQLYHWLTKNGYGVVKRKVEQSMVKKAAITGSGVPANFSPEAKQSLEQLKVSIKEDHPYGTFWSMDENDKLGISRESLYHVSRHMGFRFHQGDVVQVIDQFIYKRTDRFYFDAIKQYIHEEDPDYYEDICNAYESFVQKSGAFTITRLDELDESLVLKDDQNTCYKLYANGFLIITSTEIKFNTYELMEKLAWAHNKQTRDYKFGSGGKYIEYLKLATTRYDEALKVLGYLAHEYKDETTGYIIVLTEQCPDPKLGGGSGKNVFCNLLKLTTTYTSKPGAQAKFDEKFFQSWNGQRVFGISDVPANFDFAFLKEPSTGNFIWKRLFKDEVEVDVKDGPKFVVQTNFSYEVSDGGLRRRIIPIEFTNFFTEQGGLDVYFGCHFPNGWDDEDYAGYDSLVATAVQAWLKCGRKLHAAELSATGWMKQWQQTYKSATSFVLENWDKWINDTYITASQFKDDVDKHYTDLNVVKSAWPSTAKLNLAIEAFAGHKGVQYVKEKTLRFINGTMKCRVFGELRDDVKDGQGGNGEIELF